MVNLNTKNLSTGLHCAEIHGYHKNEPDCKPLFRLPITAIIPEKVTQNFISQKILLESDKFHRTFITPPKNSNQCVITFTLLDEHDVDVVLSYCQKDKCQKNPKLLKFTPQKKCHYFSIDILKKNILEICLYIEYSAHKKLKFQIFL